MKKLISFVLLIILFQGVLSPAIQVYASEQSELDTLIDKSIVAVEQFGNIAESRLEKADIKEQNSEQKERIQDKQEEIHQYIDHVQDKLESDVDSKKELKETLEEVKKVVTLKVVSGVTEYDNLEENLPHDIASNSAKKQSALDALSDSFQSQGKVSLLVSTSFEKDKVLSLFQSYDSTVTLQSLPSQPEVHIYELSFSPESLFVKEMLGDIKEGNVPTELFGISVIEPEVFQINDISNLSGEDINATRGVNKYTPASYLLFQQNKVSVAVIDTGIDFKHTDLASNSLPGYDFVNDDSDASDDQGHGSHVAGTIGAVLNGSGIIGVNPNTNIIPLKICNDKGFCPNYAILRALDYVKDHHIPVVNMSLGGKGDPSGNPICQSIDALSDVGTIVVAAAGNSNVDASTFIPGGCKNTLTVAAVDENLTRASFSNYGNKVDISAPGVGIYSTALGGGYKKLSGTSMAAPHITGLISLLKAYDSTLDVKRAKDILKAVSTPVITTSDKQIGGFATPFNALNFLQKQPTFSFKEESTSDLSTTSSGFQQPNTFLLGDKVKIDTSLQPIVNQEEKQKEVAERNGQLGKSTKPHYSTHGNSENKILDFLNTGSGIVSTYSQEDAKIDTIIVPELLETTKPVTYTGATTFGPDGKPQESSSIQELSGEDSPKALDLFSLIGIPNNQDELKSPQKPVELFIDGAEKETQINSIENGTGGEERYFSSVEDTSSGLLNTGSLVPLIPSVEGESGILGISSLNFSPSQIDEFPYISMDGQTSSVDDGVRLIKISGDAQVESDTVVSPETFKNENFTPISSVPEVESNGLEVADAQIIDVQIYQTKTAYIYPASSYFPLYNLQYVFSDTTVASSYVSYKYLYFTGLKAGETEVKAYQNGINVLTFHIKVLPPPVPQEINITLKEGETVPLILPVGAYSSKVITSIGKVDFTYISPGSYQVTGLAQGDFQRNFSDAYGDMSGFTKFIVKIYVIGLPPIEHNSTLYETQEVYTNIIAMRTIKASESGKVKTYTSNGRLVFSALSPGSVKLYIFDQNGKNTDVVNITILPKPTPKVYEVTLNPYGLAQVTLPDPIANYRLQVDSTAILSDGGKYLVTGPNTFTINVINNGTSNIYLKDGNGFDIYIIKVTVKPEESTMDMNQTDSIYVGTTAYDVSSTNPNVVSPSSTLYAVAPGTADIFLARYGVKLRLIHVTVHPIPTPQELSFNTIINQNYTYMFRGSLVNKVETSIPYELNRLNNAFKLNSFKSGFIKVYIKSQYGDYITHILTIRSSALPPVIVDCTIPVGYRCSSYETDTTQGYTFGTNASGLTQMSTESYLVNAGTPNQLKYYKYILTGLKTGTGEVYIYKNDEHIVTVQTNILPPPPPLSFEGNQTTVREGEQIKLKVTGGAAPYKKGAYDSANLNYRVDSTTGDIVITGTKYGNYSVEVQDKYNQTLTFGVTILDAYLTPSSTNVDLVAGDNTTVSIDDYYVALEPITKSNNNIDIVQVDVANPDQPNKPRKYLQIFAKTAGQTIIGLKDAEGTQATITVNVVGNTTPIEEEIVENTEVTLDFPEILNITYTPEVEEGGIGGLMFHTIGEIQELGVEFENADGIQEKEVLSPQTDGFYVVAFTEETCGGKCNNFQPYIIDTSGNKIYSSFQPKANIVYTTGVSTASVETDNENVKLQSSYSDFETILKQIWYSGGYNTAYQTTKKKIIDVREKYGEVGSQLVSLIPIVGEGYDISTLILGKDPITNEELGTLGKTATLVGLVSGAGSGAGARKLVDEGLEKLAKSLGVSLDEITTVSLEVAKEYKIDKLEDIVKLKEELSLTKFLKKVKIKYFLKKIRSNKLFIHIFRGEINESGNATGVHSILAIKNGTAKFDGAKTDLGNGFYNSYVRVFSQNLYNQHKANYDTWLSNPANVGKEYTYMKIEDFGWKKKDKISTFFPDSRSKEKIKSEIAEAWGVKILQKIEPDGRKKYTGQRNGYIVEIWEDVNGVITSVYPVL